MITDELRCAGMHEAAEYIEQLEAQLIMFNAAEVERARLQKLFEGRDIEKAIVFIEDIKRVVDGADQNKTSCMVNIPFERAFNLNTVLSVLRRERR